MEMQNSGSNMIDKIDTTNLNKSDLHLFTLKNKNGMVVQITNYGATIVSINVPDRDGKIADVVQGYDTVEEYVNKNKFYYGATCGRCANRISEGTFSLNGNKYSLAINDGPNHIHGGLIGFDKKVWNVVEFTKTKVVFHYISPNGDEGYPGNVSVKVTYTITDNDELRMDYTGVTDQDTLLNLVNHSYFNLAGEGSGPIYDHLLKIEADFYTPISKTGTPTGEILTVKNTPFDFTSLTPIGERINSDQHQIVFREGYDHNFVLRHRFHSLDLAATVIEPQSGRKLEVLTTNPGLHLYTANWVNDKKGKNGKIYHEQWSFCLETQNFPDAINHSHFPSTILKPKETYEHSTVYRFSTV